MDTQGILRELEFNNGSLPRQALREAVSHWDEVMPEFLKIIKETELRAEDILQQDNYMAHIYAIYLLAHFREKRAYPIIVDFFSLPGEISLDITGDVVTEDLGRILASVSCGDTSLMQSLVEDENVNEYVRSAVLSGLVTLVVCGEISREEVIAYFQSMFRGRIKKDFSYIWTGLVLYSIDLYPEEVYHDIKKAYEEDLVEPFIIGLEDVEETLNYGKEYVLNNLKENKRYTLIGDIIKETEWWSCFNKPRYYKPEKDKKKIGRNEPCPCGSGKKYKKCCGR